MPVPRQKVSKSKRNKRRAHHALRAPGLTYCQSCGEAKPPHVVCVSCGTYKGEQVQKGKGSTEFGGEDFNVEG